MKRLEDKIRRRQRRKARVRGKISGTLERPRITVYKSNKHTYVQVIDDVAGKTLASVSNIEEAFRGLKNTVEDAEKLGVALGERLKALNVGTVVFDRNGYLFHGIVKAVAEGARKTGIKF